MKTNIGILLFSLVAINVIQAQQIVWERFIEEPFPRRPPPLASERWHVNSSITKTLDGGYLLCNDMSIQVSNLMKLDKNGNTEKVKVFLPDTGDYSHARTTMLHNAYQRDDGVIVSVGIMGSGLFPDGDFFIQKSKADLEPFWRYPSYETTWGMRPTAWLHSKGIYLPTENGFLIASKLISGGSIDGDLEFIKADSNAVEVWKKVFPSGKWQAEPISMKRTRDGNVVIICNVQENFYRNVGAIYFIKTKWDDSTVLVDKVYQKIPERTFYSDFLEPSSGTGLMLLTHSIDTITGLHYPVLIRTDDTLGIWWKKDIRIKNRGSVIPTKFVQTKQGDFVIIGYSAKGTNMGDIHIFKTDSLGNLKWEKAIEGDDEYELLTDMVLEDDGNVVVTGRYHLADPEKDVVLYVAKISDKINSTDEEQKQSMDKINVSPNPANVELNVELAGEKKSVVELYNISGKKVLSRLVANHNSLSSKIVIDISALENGVYNVVVKSEAGVQTKKIIINH